MRPLAAVSAQHLAIVTLLRAIGHVLANVDADTPEKQQWLSARWPEWKREPIFARFIELNRNRLLKEFRGGLRVGDGAIVSTAAVADPRAPGGASVLVAIDAGALRGPQGEPVLDQFRAALEFWDRRLVEAERAF
jgi:hypothetical protein